MKGVSPVIAVILLLLITIAVVGLAFGFFSRLAQSSGTQAEQGAGALANQTSVGVRIDNVATAGGVTTVVLRNAGSATLEITRLGAYVDNTVVTLSGAGCIDVAAGGRATCALSSTCGKGSVFRVTTTGTGDQVIC